MQIPCGGYVTFLSPNKKVTKEVGLGEALTVKPFVTASVSFLFYPVFKPSSPKTLSRPLSLAGSKSSFRFHIKRAIQMDGSFCLEISRRSGSLRNG